MMVYLPKIAGPKLQKSANNIYSRFNKNDCTNKAFITNIFYITYAKYESFIIRQNISDCYRDENALNGKKDNKLFLQIYLPERKLHDF